MSSAENTFVDNNLNSNTLGAFFEQFITGIWLRNVVLFLSLILAAALVGAGSFSRRYRRHGSIRLLFLGAYTLFLPLVSYIISGVNKDRVDNENYKLPDGIELCYNNSAMYLLVWAGLVQIVGANYCTANPAYDDELPRFGPIVQMLLGVIWTSFLIVQEFIRYRYVRHYYYWLIVTPCGVSLAKILAKLYAYVKSWRSFEIGGRNPRLIAGYMEQFYLTGEVEHGIPLILMGEDKQKVQKGPYGYQFTDGNVNGSTLVTSDMIANMVSVNDNIALSLKSGPPFEDLCLSFSLFKLLRQRFTRCPIVKTDCRCIPNFMIKLRQSEDAQDIMSMIEHELYFACDFYNSYLPASCSTWWLPILNVLLASFVIAYCSATQVFLVLDGVYTYKSKATEVICKSTSGELYGPTFGHIWVLDVLTSFLALAVLLSEAWEVISYTCSNWTKVNLIYYYITKTSRQGSTLMKKLICCILRFKCSALNGSYKMGQTSLMDTNMKVVKVVRRLLQLPDQKMEYVEIKPQVSTAILDMFRASNWTLPAVKETLKQSSIGNNNNILLACNGEGTSDVILVWHIATCIFEIKNPYEPTNAPAVTASQLSRYCAYLLSSAPDLLPDDKEWSKNLYKSVKKITEPIFSSRSNKRHMQYESILQQLDEKCRSISQKEKREKCRSNNELKNGIALGKFLVDETQGSEQEGWEILARFWSAMVLYIAPSNNAGAHQEAIARGGELITILWAMLTHAGIVSRPRTRNDV